MEISSGQIILNGKPVTNHEIKLPPDFYQPSITLDAEEYYAIGNNPDLVCFEKSIFFCVFVAKVIL